MKKIHEINNDPMRLLRILLILLSERSVTRASNRLGLSQPALSHNLNKLRALFGDTLLIRSSKGLIPTTRALELESELIRLVTDYDRLTQQAELFDPLVSSRTFVMTAPEFGERMLVPHLFKELRLKAPNVRVEVRAPIPDRVNEMLEKGELDLRIAWLVKPSGSLRSLHLYQDRMVCLACARHPELNGRISLEKFLRLPHARTIGTNHATTIRVIDEALAKIGLLLERSFLVQNFMTIPSTLVGTDIIATLPYLQAKAFANEFPLQLLELPLKLPRISYGAYWHERSHKDPGHQWFRKKVQEAAINFSQQSMHLESL